MHAATGHVALEYILHLYFFIIIFDATALTTAGGNHKRRQERKSWLRSFAFSGRI